jgi:hypothetical protein
MGYDEKWIVATKQFWHGAFSAGEPVNSTDEEREKRACEPASYTY